MTLHFHGEGPRLTGFFPKPGQLGQVDRYYRDGAGRREIVSVDLGIEAYSLLYWWGLDGGSLCLSYLLEFNFKELLCVLVSNSRNGHTPCNYLLKS